ncbi:PREDICTED: uncharacterized protein LOC109161617 isoform X1 [Ipomoea nil]|uniref:uncharacterized protein LOC109161617 isoform X1 n=1 Tax=Ipomoea nil TaxID=35883 RepID=UPI000901503E|nr:PREDICTED: uncharacterized protein LOC109161617 isoform X1 [Ipomoea nil]
MKPKETGQTLNNLPKKKLQELCKKYGLSPYKTKPFLVDSLISFFKETDVETFEAIQCSLENNQSSSYIHNTRGKASASPFIPQTDRIAFKDTVHTTQASSSKTTFVSGVKSVHAPFEFSVMSEEGVNLIVDLNSCVSDWFKRLENEVCVCKSLQKQKFQSFRQELQNLGNKQLTNLFTRETDSDYRNQSFVHTVSSPILCSEANGVSGNQDKGDRLLESSATKSGYHSEKYSACMGEKEEPPPLSRHSSNLRNEIVSDTYLREETGSTDPNASYASEGIVETNATGMALCGPEKILENQDAKFHNALTSGGKQTSSFIEDVIVVKPEGKLENQNVKLRNENCTDRDTQSTCSLDKPMVLLDVPSANDTTEAWFSDAKFHEKYASCSSVHDCSMDLVDVADSIKPGGYSDSCEDNHSSFVDNKPKSGGNLPQGNHIISSRTHLNDRHLKGKESSDKLLKRLEFASDGKQRRKRSNGESDKGFSCNEGRNLRSAKRLQVLPRRSMRLVSSLKSKYMFL